MQARVVFEREEGAEAASEGDGFRDKGFAQGENFLIVGGY